MFERTFTLPFPIDVAGTWRALRRGRFDPTCRVTAAGLWRATRTGEGPATVRVVPDGDRIVATAWGDGAEAALDAVPALVGCHDDDHGFAPTHPLVARLWRDLRRVRLPRSGSISETLVNVVLEQRVTTFEARRSQRQVVARWGDDAPGPGGLRLPADPDRLADVAYYDLHVVGVEQKRADTVRRVAASARRLDALALLAPAEAHRRLHAVPGVGAWSAAETALVALGDPDAVPVGDYHLPRQVTLALCGEAIDSDDVMLELLEPFAGQRGRVVRLVTAAGIRAPRRGPRYAPRDIGTQ